MNFGNKRLGSRAKVQKSPPMSTTTTTNTFIAEPEEGWEEFFLGVEEQLAAWEMEDELALDVEEQAQVMQQTFQVSNYTPSAWDMTCVRLEDLFYSGLESGLDMEEDWDVDCSGDEEEDEDEEDGNEIVMFIM